MNVNNVLRSISQSRKLLPISIYGADVKPCIPADRQFFDVISPALKLLLKAFKTAGFTAYVSKWGELAMYSASLSIEVLVRVSPNLSYMSETDAGSIENVGYEVLEIEIPLKPFLFSYFFLGTASKWRHISFDTELTTIESMFVNLIEPILKASRPFHGRLKASLLQQQDESVLSHNTLYAFACYASCHIEKAYGLTMYRKHSDEKYVRKCFVNSYGAVLLTHSWPTVAMVNWSKNDLKFFEKYLPAILLPYEIQCPNLSSIIPECSEHKILLDALDNVLRTVNDSIDTAEEWLGRAQYFSEKPAKTLLVSSEGVIRLIAHLIN